MLRLASGPAPSSPCSGAFALKGRPTVATTATVAWPTSEQLTRVAGLLNEAFSMLEVVERPIREAISERLATSVAPSPPVTFETLGQLSEFVWMMDNELGQLVDEMKDFKAMLPELHMMRMEGEHS
jgi:hypothetical protein